ncbi:ribonuclease T2 [Tabrizicola sp. J26]|uniref:ribonuclease T2 n=1 Tax=Alitabrizicola rongguiensis TaxID=2909234 RepID=UPI001F32D0B1|nr:ribonuclease T2 [Tabrizicola rongguiensis]MCF1707638.1 ribonuclease T2 [Tabrizicola rongguiensis]
MLRLLLLCAMIGEPALAEGEKAGNFDYYVLSLGWSPNWCALEGDERGDDQCDTRHDYGFTLHGLWPQYESGWPSYCRTTARDPSKAETAAMADITGSGGLAWYEWKKHGRCSGLSSAAYFNLARRAYGSIRMPEVFTGLSKEVKLPASVVEDAFIEANPDLPRDAITVTCQQGMIQEVRICLTTDLEPRRCGMDTIRDCRLKDAVMEPVR